jgi:glycogen synthase
MRILFLSDLYPPVSIGGYEMRCQETLEALRERGHVTALLTGMYAGKDAPAEAGVVRRLHSSPVNPVFATLQPDPLTLRKRIHQLTWARECRQNYNITREVITGFKPEVVFIWNMQRVGVTPILAAQEAGLPCVYNLGEYWLLELKNETALDPNPLKRAFRRWMLGMPGFERLDLRYLITVSQALKQKYVEAGFCGEAICTIPRGIPASLVRPLGDARAPDKKADGKLRLAFVGRVSPEKGPDVAIRAVGMASRASEGLDIHLDVIGTGDEGYLDELKRLARAEGLEAKVHFLGWMERGAIFEAYDEHDALVFPSRWEEPLGVSVLEALARGLPVIASRCGGVPETIADGETGLLVPPDDPVALAGAIRRLATDDGLAERLRQAGLAEVHEHYTQAGVVNRLEAALCAAAGKG